MPGSWRPDPEATQPGLCACRSFAGEDSTCDRCGLRSLPLGGHFWNDATKQWERLPEAIELGPPRVRPRPRRKTPDEPQVAPNSHAKGLDMAGRPLDPMVANLEEERERLVRLLLDRLARVERAQQLVRETRGLLLQNGQAIDARIREIARNRKGQV